MGMQSAAIYRPATNPFFNRHYIRTLEYLTGPAFAQGKRGIAGFVRHLKSGGIAAMLFDVRATHYGCIDFFGHPAPTSTFAAELALKTGAVFLPVFARRLPDVIGHEIAFEAPIPASTPVGMMTELTRRLETRILRDPEQWLWIHDRWGTPEQRQRWADERKDRS
jgi:KDO2-lipid IV(A) lauroyltransferase